MAVPAPTTDPAPPASSRRTSRRTVLAGVLGTGLLAAVGVPVVRQLAGDGSPAGSGRPGAPASGGKHVRELLASSGFVVAHRGGSPQWPEFSLAAYQDAVAAGADALEISLARSSDGVWFGLHDATLDRTSGTSGFVAAEHTWADISAHRSSAASSPGQRHEPQPYLRFEDLVSAYARTHTLFVDPKVAGPAFFAELLTLMNAVPDARDCFVAKYYCTGSGWARAARKNGYTTWGYYYGKELDDGTTPPSATQADWDVLGLDVAASPTDWAAVLHFGKPVIGHIVATSAQARTVLAAGARGLMASDVRAALGS